MAIQIKALNENLHGQRCNIGAQALVIDEEGNATTADDKPFAEDTLKRCAEMALHFRVTGRKEPEPSPKSAEGASTADSSEEKTEENAKTQEDKKPADEQKTQKPAAVVLPKVPSKQA